MLIVYQSLESTGTKADHPSTFMTGNSFKKRVHENLGKISRHHKTPTWDGQKIVFTSEEVETAKFATPAQSKALSNTLKADADSAANETSIAILEKIVARITANAAQCTRPNNLERPFVSPPDIIVLGEIYASSLKDKNIAGYVVIGGIDPTGDARHRFTVLVKADPITRQADTRYVNDFQAWITLPEGSPAQHSGVDAKCILLKLRGWLVACVHTPNAICNLPESAAKYLHRNAQRAGEGSKLDLVIGDTNQGSSDTVRAYMNAHYNRRFAKARASAKKQLNSPLDQWRHSISATGTQVVRGYSNYEVSGTNSGYTKHFDIACSPEAIVTLSGLTVHHTKDDQLMYSRSTSDRLPAFIFHGLTEKFIEWDGLYYAYSDHNGVIIEILRDKPEHFTLNNEKRKRDLKEEFMNTAKRQKQDSYNL
jgi:hypothetical protein